MLTGDMPKGAMVMAAKGLSIQDRQFLERRRTELKQERVSFIPHWRELSDYLSPRTAKFLIVDKNQGAKANQKIINSTATTAHRTLRSGCMAGITSPARPWFRLLSANDEIVETAAIKQWLFDVETKMRTCFNRSNFYNTLPPVYGSLGAYGTGAMAIMEDEKDTIRCESFAIGSYAFALDANGRPDTFVYEFSMSVRQLVAEFGIENVSEQVRTMHCAGNLEQQIEVAHLVQPNKDRDCCKLDSKNKKFMSVKWEIGKAQECLLSEKGFDEFPFMIPRWDVSDNNDLWGYSPGMDALGDIKQLQLMERRKMEAIDKLVRPPMLADATLRTQRTSSLPGDVTYIDNLAAQQHAGYRPAFEVNPRIAELMGEIQNIEGRINKVFYTDLMLMFASSDDPTMTAREVEERHQEKLLILGPVLERLNTELLNPAIERTFFIMLRKGLIPEPPRELAGQTLKVEYISIMAQAQKLIGVANLSQFFSFVGNLAAAKGTPEIWDKVNCDHAVDEFGNMQGISPKIINSDDDVAAMRQQRAQQEKQQQMLQAAPAMAQAATAAKTLSDTSVDSPSALTRLMGAQG
jgi:hypothetical protein